MNDIEEAISYIENTKKYLLHLGETWYADYLDDAIELLKEQDAELSYRYAKTTIHTATKLDDATCPSCGNVVGEKIRTGAIGQSVVQVRWDYCRFCGQKLDWEGR